MLHFVSVIIIIYLFVYKSQIFIHIQIYIYIYTVIRKILEVKRPVEYDPRLRPTTDTNAESYGFPSIESYMSVIVFGLLIKHFQSNLFTLISLCCIFIVGFSRVYTCARFPHQIIGSWLLGFVGLVSSEHFVIHNLRVQQ